MATSKEFQEKFKSGDFLAAFKMALSEVVHLNITTTVVTAESPTVADPDSAPEVKHRMRTQINLLDGDIKTEINSRFLDDGRSLRRFAAVPFTTSCGRSPNNPGKYSKFAGPPQGLPADEWPI